MDSVRLGETLCFEDGDYILESIQGATLGLRNTRSAQRMAVHISALPALLATPRIFTAARPGPRSIEAADSKAVQRAFLLGAHLEEMMVGTNIDGGDTRPEYNLKLTSQAERLDRKAQELRSLGIPCGIRTLRRWSQDYRLGGVAALLDQRAERQQDPFGRLDERVKQALLTVIAGETNASTGSVVRLIRKVRTNLLETYPGEDIGLPSERSFRRYIDLLTQGKYTTGNAANRRSAANAPNRMFNSRAALAPGHEVQIDTSKFDVLVLTGVDPSTGAQKVKRANLVIMLDKATQSIIATSVRLEGVKGVDLAFMLAQCLTPRTLRPEGIIAFNEYELAVMPWADFLTADEAARAETTRPFIKPQRIMKDNGADYASAVFESACAQFGIDTTSAATGTPTDKPNVERAFDTIKTKFAQYLPGFSGGTVDMRGDQPEKEDLLDVFTLTELFDRWVAIVWQNMQHESLRDPVLPSVIHSPNSMYQAMFPMTGYVPLPLSSEDYIAFLPSELRTIQMDGVQLDYRRYDAPELHLYRCMKSGDSRHGGKWTVHYNPHDPSAVWIRDPDGEGFIQCDWMNRDAFARPFSATIRRNAREATAALGVLGDPASTEATIELIGATKAAIARHAAEEQRRESAMRLAGIAGAAVPAAGERALADENQWDGESGEALEYEELRLFDPGKDVT